MEDTLNVLKHHGIVAGPMGRSGKDVDVFTGNSAFPVLAREGGFVEHLVGLNERVEPGQKLATQRNSVGETVSEYRSGVSGVVTGQRGDAMAQPGNRLTFVPFHQDMAGGGETYPE